MPKHDSLFARISKMWPGTHFQVPGNGRRHGTIDVGAVVDDRDGTADAAAATIGSATSLVVVNDVATPAAVANLPPLAETVLGASAPLSGIEIVRRINETWRRSAANIFQVCLWCAELSQRCPPKERSRLIRRLPFDRRRFYKLRRAGQDQRLHAIHDQLPPSESTICMLSRLDNEEFAEAVDAKLINTSLKRGELATWRSQRRRAPASNAAVEPMGRYATVYIEADLPAEVFAKLNEALATITIAKLPGLKVV